MYVDGWYLVIRVATAMQTIAPEHQLTVTQRTLLVRRKNIIAMSPKSIVIVFDGVGAGANKLPRRSPNVTDDVLSLVIECVDRIFSDIASTIRLSPGVEADDFIITNSTPTDVIISDDSDMLAAGATVVRFNGDVYLPGDVLIDAGRAIGKVVTLHQLKKAMDVARGDKRVGIGIVTALRDVVE